VVLSDKNRMKVTPPADIANYEKKEVKWEVRTEKWDIFVFNANQ
jgi:hypothetical protein